MKRFLGLTLAGLVAAPALANTIANWTFETSLPNGTGGTNGPHVAEAGDLAALSTALGSHANAATVWSNPVGNGSNESFSSNTWTVGDYYQYRTSTALYDTIVLSWDQTRSSTGPEQFDVAWSTDGVNFSVISDNYVVNVVTWSSAAPIGGSSFTLNLPAGANGATDLYIRFIDQTAPGGTAGTNRMDNVRIDGNLVPEPASLALLAMGGMALIRRR